MRLLVGLVLVAACGSVQSEDKKMDAAVAQIDAPDTCTVHDQITSCGPTCAVCTAATDREMATCDGTACGMLCVGGNPRCSDNTCSRLVFDFESGLQGTIMVAPAGVQPAVRMHDGTMALAFDFTSNLANTQLEFRVPVCLSGAIDQSTKRLKAAVHFQGTAGNQEDYYVQGSVPLPATNQYLGTQTVGHNVTTIYDQPMNASTGSRSFNTVTFRIGSLGGEFIGTVWVDNIRIE